MEYKTLGELLYWSYANLQMMDAAQSMGLTDYNRTCFMIRSKAYRAYKNPYGTYMIYYKRTLPRCAQIIRIVLIAIGDLLLMN